jgi:signal transduction histidine kinase
MAQLLALGSKSSVAMRLAPNRLYLLYRHSQALSLAATILVLLAFGLGFMKVRRRARVLREVQWLALEAAPAGFLFLNRDGTVSWANHTLRRWTATPEERSRKSPRVERQFSGAPDLLAFCRLLLSTDPPRHRDVSVKLGEDKPVRLVKLSAEPVNRGRGGADWLIRAEDMSREDELAESRTWALMAERVAHDLRNPLTSMLLTIRRLRIEYRESAPEIASRLDSYCERIEDRVDHLRRLTSNLMKLMRADEPTRERIAVRDLIESQAHVLRTSVPPDIDLKLQTAADGPTVTVDREQMDSVLQNLVANAVNAMPNGGEVTISTRYSRVIDGPDAERGRRTALIEVADSGVGIDSSIRHRIFDPGFTTSSHGSGLGLAMVRKIVVDHGGSIEVESEPGTGTVVSIFLPTDADPQSSDDAARN